MTLLEVLIKKLPECAGWPKDAARCIYHEHKEGATFYDAEGAMVKNGVGFIDLCIPDVRREEVTREQYEAALAASKPEWDGEGLPPVGCECEYETKFDGWQPVRIELIKSEGIAFTWMANSQAYNGLDCVGVQKSGSFRPKRPEAERKRDETVKEFVRQLIECVDLHAMDKRRDAIVREKLYSMLPTLPGVTVND